MRGKGEERERGKKMVVRIGEPDEIMIFSSSTLSPEQINGDEDEENAVRSFSSPVTERERNRTQSAVTFC